MTTIDPYTPRTLAEPTDDIVNGWIYEGSWFDGIDVPDDQATTHEEVTTLRTEAIDHLDAAIELAGSGDTVAAQRNLEEGYDRLTRTATRPAMTTNSFATSA